MNKKNLHIKIFATVAFMFFAISCKKYLEEKTSKSLVIPSTIADAQAMLDYYMFINQSNFSDGTIMDDNYWITDKYYDTRNTQVKNEYIWSKDAAADDYSWTNNYTNVMISNTALEVIDKIEISSNNIDAYNNVKGTAYFIRAFSVFNVLNVFSLQYEPNSASNNLGVPYKFTSSVNEHVYRPSIAQTYEWIEADLKAAALLLTPASQVYPSRPNKAAAFGVLARLYLTKADYSNALKYADSALRLNNQLMNFNTLNLTTNTSPFSRFNIEDMFHAVGGGWGVLNYPNWNCDSLLFAQFDLNDLRRSAYFRKNSNGLNTYSFKGSYDPNTNLGPFSGIANDELYLIRAEGYARSGNVKGAIDDLNSLLVTRWRTGTYSPYPTSMSQQDALDLVLAERRKELIQRNNLRWLDIKRLNLESRYAKTLTRTLKGIVYTLPPGDKRFALLIPPTTLSLGGFEQNPR